MRKKNREGEVFMKLLLTSTGITNKSIENGLKQLLNKEDFNNLKMLFCTTASNYQGGKMNEWLIENLIYLNNLGFEIDVCDINGIDKEKIINRFEWADVFFFEGGNVQWLREAIKKSGLEGHLKDLLKTRVWVGASAGSSVLCPTVCNSCHDLFDEKIEDLPKDGLNLVNFQFVPHLNNELFPKITIDNLKNASRQLSFKDGKKVYIVDDNGAVIVDDNEIRIVSEGIWYEI